MIKTRKEQIEARLKFSKMKNDILRPVLSKHNTQPVKEPCQVLHIDFKEKKLIKKGLS